MRLRGVQPGEHPDSMRHFRLEHLPCIIDHALLQPPASACNRHAVHEVDSRTTALARGLQR